MGGWCVWRSAGLVCCGAAYAGVCPLALCFGDAGFRGCKHLPWLDTYCVFGAGNGLLAELEDGGRIVFAGYLAAVQLELCPGKLPGIRARLALSCIRNY